MTTSDEPATVPSLDEIPTPAEVFVAPHDPATVPVTAGAGTTAEQVGSSAEDATAHADAEPHPAPDDAEPKPQTETQTELQPEPEPEPDPVEHEPDPADLVAAAVLAVDGVAGLHGGTFGEVASYLPGRRVEGIRLTDEITEVHLVLQWGAPVLATADAVRAVVAPLVRTPVDITVQDVVGPDAGNRALTSPTKETA